MSKKNPRVLLCEFAQESNTFNPIVMPAEHFNIGGAFEGEAVFKNRMSVMSAVHGAADIVIAAGGEVIPTVFASAPSGGRVADSMLSHIKERMGHYIDTVGEFDAVYACLHGATCTETENDACGNFIEFLREKVGTKLIAVSFDLHANVTDRILANADFVCGYQTYPHRDYYRVGQRAASLCIGKLRGEKTYTAEVALPLLLPPAGYTDESGAFKNVVDSAKAMVDDGRLLDYSIFVVQPWLDVDKIASRIIAISKDPDTAKICAEKLANELFSVRGEMWPELKTVDEIIDIAEANTTGKTVILADSADSPNGGAVGDSPVVAMRLIERGSKLTAGVFIKDPAAVRKAFETGVGNTAEFTVGAGYTVGMPGPLKACGKVRSLHDGKFRTGSSSSASIGSSAVISFGSVDVLVGEKGASSGMPALYRSFGIEPSFYDLIVVKANTSFRLHYNKISDLIYVADTPGAGASNLKRFEWKNIPKGTYPIDLPSDYKVGEANIL